MEFRRGLLAGEPVADLEQRMHIGAEQAFDLLRGGLEPFRAADVIRTEHAQVGGRMT